MVKPSCWELSDPLASSTGGAQHHRQRQEVGTHPCMGGAAARSCWRAGGRRVMAGSPAPRGGQKVRAPGRPVFSGRCGPGPPGVAGAHRVGTAHSLGPVPPGGIANGHHVLNTEAQLYSTQSGPGMLSPGPGPQGMPSPTRGGGRPGCEAGTSELRPLRPALGSHCC